MQKATLKQEPTVAAFFDLDRTVLTTSSGTLWARFLRREGRMSLLELARVGWWTLEYKLALIDFEAVVRGLAETYRGQREADLLVDSDRWFQEMVAPCIAPQARECIAEHRARGHTVAILTASTDYVGAPVARDLGLDGAAICTRLEVVDGVFTGRCIEPICYGAGKVYWAERFAEARGLDLAVSYFYTDSYTDLAMLEAVGHPVAVNPDPRLRRLAAKRGWPEERFY